MTEKRVLNLHASIDGLNNVIPIGYEWLPLF